MSVKDLAVAALVGVCASAFSSATPAHAESVPTGVLATAARAEAEGFAALEEQRDCDAARSFLLAHSLAPDGRLVVNAALALERYGALAQALELFESVQGTPAAVVADVDARIDALEVARDDEGDGAVCTGAALDDAQSSAQSAAQGGSPLFPVGIAVLAGGFVVAGSTVGTMAWLQGITQDAAASGADREGALAAQLPVLYAGGTLASVLVVTAAVLVPLSLMPEPQ